MKLGIIGGSGLYNIEGMTAVTEHAVNTPFGRTSDTIKEGTLNGASVFFLPRHGRNHQLLPAEVNHKANIFALKKLGVTHILSISAVGSLREDYIPRDVVIVDQFFDRTKKSLEHTFFGNGIVAHIAFAHPICPELALIAGDAAEEAVRSLAQDSKSRMPVVHRKGTYLNMEGPAFSTVAESKVYRSWGLDVIGMTNLGEAKLAREAEICYASVAMVTDFDSWHPEHDHVTTEMIISTFSANVALAKKIISNVAAAHKCLKRECACKSALAAAFITPKNAVPKEVVSSLKPIIGKYF